MTDHVTQAAELVERLRTYRTYNDWADEVRHEICEEAADLIERLSAELAARSGGWQDIVTAPKDGTLVLIWVDNMAVSAAYDEEDHEWYSGRWGLGFVPNDVSHWMPNPTPPATEQGEG